MATATGALAGRDLGRCRATDASQGGSQRPSPVPGAPEGRQEPCRRARHRRAQPEMLRLQTLPVAKTVTRAIRSGCGHLVLFSAAAGRQAAPMPCVNCRRRNCGAARGSGTAAGAAQRGTGCRVRQPCRAGRPATSARGGFTGQQDDTVFHVFVSHFHRTHLTPAAQHT